MTPTPHNARSNAAVAVQRLRELIFSGALPPGSDHLESELALMLGISRTPVREASLTLRAQGLIEIRPRKGIRILPLSPDDMADIYDVMTELEGLAAANAATSHVSVSLDLLASHIDAMDAALAQDDRHAWAEADDAFHTELVLLGGNSRAIGIAAMLADQVRRVRGVTLFIRPLPKQSNDDHRAVLNAIRTGDPEAARRLHTAHRTAAKIMLLDLLDQHQLNRL